MKNKWFSPLSFGLGILVTLLVPLLLLATGAINMGADAKPGLIERTLAPWALDRSVDQHAPAEKNPYTGNAPAIAIGLDHYRENCLMCHGAPEAKASELSRGLNPQAPSLAKESDTPDGELFWIVKHGLRMTPMPAFGPTHTDEEIWKIVAFIRHLPELSPQEREALREPPADEDHHHDEPSGNLPKDSAQPARDNP
jgi:mono/diheme cytochrome c family protein